MMIQILDYILKLPNELYCNLIQNFCFLSLINSH